MAYPAPKVWYKFQDNLLDSSGNNHHLTGGGTVIYGDNPNAQGSESRALISATTQIESPYEGVTGNNPWTFSFWFYTSNAGSYRFPIYYGADPRNFDRGAYWEYTEYVLSFRSNHHFLAKDWNYSWQYGNWYHLTNTYNGAGYERFYVNGSYLDDWNHGHTLLFGNDTTIRFYIGFNGYLLPGTGGHVDEIRAWEIALTDEEVMESYLDTPPPGQIISGASLKNVIIGG